MHEWQLQLRDLKKYPHFDAVVSAAEAEALAKDASKVTKHKFYPFIRYNTHWTQYADKDEAGNPKDREIRYAARRDAYIFSYYRYLLSIRYEAELERTGLAKSILAYRRITSESGDGGKCNIHFALDAARKIQELGTCCAIALDISKFFENLDHERLRLLWCRMLRTERLPDDHFCVFKAITRYSVVDKQAVYERLGHYGPKRKTKNGKVIRGYLTPYKDIPKQLCTGKVFREKIAGNRTNKSIIETNFKSYGIPQGAPISDLLANLYLLDFDAEVSRLMSDLGGYYYRYSDDILLIVPGDESLGAKIEEDARNLIPKYGNKLFIKESKSSVVFYRREGERQCFKLVKGSQGVNGLEYLGFRYDGNKIYIRNSTIQNLYRKVTYAARREAMGLARRYPNKSAEELRALCNYESFTARFGRIEAFNEKQADYRTWTFWTYAKRAASVMGTLGSPIGRQLRKHREIIRAKLDEEFGRAVLRRK
jgi:hypothetical protein